jgi:hypothetical protein
MTGRALQLRGAVAPAADPGLAPRTHRGVPAAAAEITRPQAGTAPSATISASGGHTTAHCGEPGSVSRLAGNAEAVRISGLAAREFITIWPPSMNGTATVCVKSRNRSWGQEGRDVRNPVPEGAGPGSQRHPDVNLLPRPERGVPQDVAGCWWNTFRSAGRLFAMLL